MFGIVVDIECGICIYVGFIFGLVNDGGGLGGCFFGVGFVFGVG